MSGGWLYGLSKLRKIYTLSTLAYWLSKCWKMNMFSILFWGWIEHHMYLIPLQQSKWCTQYSSRLLICVPRLPICIPLPQFIASICIILSLKLNFYSDKYISNLRWDASVYLHRSVANEQMCTHIWIHDCKLLDLLIT